MRKVLLVLALLATVITTSCEDEANDPIVINSGDDDDDVGNDGGGDTNGDCTFSGIDPSFESCVSSTSASKLEVVTWNIENFPQNGNTTLEAVKNIIANTNADVIAVQEIEEISDFESVANDLADWEAKIVDIPYILNMGFIYKSCEVSFSNPTTLNIIEPRPAVSTVITHSNGLEVQLLNIHLKCCGGSDNIERRETASQNLKSYIDSNLSSSNVIVLGDFNDEIDNSSSPFSNFIDDSDNYMFADMSIANGSSSGYSYPSYPSHIDHLLITNELFDNLESTQVIKLSSCVSGYSYNVSDHRPVMATFKGE